VGTARRRLIVVSFWTQLGLAYAATTLLASGVSHGIGFGSFRNLIRDHAIIPSRAAPLVAAATLLAELAAGTMALVLLLRRSATVPTLLFFAAIGALGVAFVFYIRRLLRRPHTTSGCGCTPLSSPLTPASQLPGAALAAVSVTALAATFLQNWYAGPGGFGALTVLPTLWGVTLAFLVMLVPASTPSPTVDSGR
jgi:hypothetical protein